MVIFIFIRKLLTRRKTRLVVITVSCLAVILLFSSCGIWYFERDQDLSFFDCFWLSVVTMTTVGYGDFTPKTPVGRIFMALVTMVAGIGVMAYLVSLVATHVIEREFKIMNGLIDLKFKGHILIINCPNEEKVHAIIDELRVDNRSYEVPIVLISDDFDQCPDQLMRRKNFFFVKGSPLLNRILERANAEEASQAVILARDPKNGNSDGLTTQVALALESMRRRSGRKVYVVAEAVNRDSIGPLETAGVDDAVCLENLVPPIIVQSILDPGIPEVISQLSSKLKEQRIYVVPLPPGSFPKYGSIRENLLPRDEARIIPMGLIRNGKPLLNPPDSLEISDGDRFVYIAAGRQSLGALFEGADHRS
ncbi:MAG: ion transporter [Desulfomonile tiedjei]|uniref:Ion transporter n=1 Tax=Desulfomonile tiedjei TaxID=2358 RepID=A0A9D6Z426_9BACT|nr:ion transporter [Desulfomonile tiedjei]